MGLISTFIPPDDRRAALMLYGMVIATCFNGADAGVVSVMLNDPQFKEYYHTDSTRQGVIAVIPWATQALAQLYVGGSLAAWIGRLWTIRCAM